MSLITRFTLLLALILGTAGIAQAGEDPHDIEDGGVAGPAEAGAIKLVTLKMGTGVEKRRLKGENTAFRLPDEPTVHAYAVFNNRTGPAQQVRMVWYKDGKRKWAVDLNVGKSSRWRTWSRSTMKRVSQMGNWEVKVFDEDGVELGSTTFEVTHWEPGEM
ncbi:MAG: DUF2914 domain-containing protein [Bradymonadia bacterium]